VPIALKLESLNFMGIPGPVIGLCRDCFIFALPLIKDYAFSILTVCVFALLPGMQMISITRHADDIYYPACR